LFNKSVLNVFGKLQLNVSNPGEARIAFTSEFGAVLGI
jgi:hypothetical protein